MDRQQNNNTMIAPTSSSSSSSSSSSGVNNNQQQLTSATTTASINSSVLSSSPTNNATVTTNSIQNIKCGEIYSTSSSSVSPCNENKNLLDESVNKNINNKNIGSNNNNNSCNNANNNNNATSNSSSSSNTNIGNKMAIETKSDGGSSFTTCNNAVNTITSASSSVTTSSTAATTSTSTASLLRQNMNSNSNISPPGSIAAAATTNASSPHSASDHSNSTKNLSSNLPQQTIMESGSSGGASVMDMSNLSVTPERPQKVEIGLNNSIKEEESVGKSISDKPIISSNINNANNSQYTTPILGALAAIKDEPDAAVNIKKEERIISPNMSPVGFGSMGSFNANTSIKKEECIFSPNISPVGFGSIASLNVPNTSASIPGGSSNNHQDKLNITSSSLTLSSSSSSDDLMGTATSASAIANNNISTSNDPCAGGATNMSRSGGGIGICGNTQQHSVTNSNAGGSNSLGSHCMDYKQQQNHIFVFSTQLANKGAEAVLSGQYLTIIAYHAVQPATKSFIEDFFTKNPMKMSKSQLQNSMNIYNIAVGNGGAGNVPQPWMSGGGVGGAGGGCNNLNKLHQQKSLNGGGGGVGVSKANFHSSAAPSLGNLDGKTHTPVFRHSAATVPVEARELDSGASNSELMCWENTRGGLESASAVVNDAHAMKLLDGIQTDIGSQHNRGVGATKTSPMAGGPTGGDNNLHSLHGVKVPDENLTPQQRQHREEQLAKLKKMNQFLFPENGNGDFRTAANMGKMTADAVAASSCGGRMLNMQSSGAQMDNPINSGMRSMPMNIMNQNKASICGADGIQSVLDGDSMIPSDLMELGSGLLCGSATSKGPCISTSTANSSCNVVMGNGALGNLGNLIAAGNGNGPGATNNGPPNKMIPNSTGDGGRGGSFHQNPNADNVQSKNLSAAQMHAQDINQLGMAQMEWSKWQHQYFEERLRGNNNNNKSTLDMGCMPANINVASGGGSLNLRSNSTTPLGTGASSNSATVKATQGPPSMPYHPASISSSQVKNNNFQQQQRVDSPMNINGGDGAANRDGRSSINNQFNSNASTPLSHISPKDLESFHTNTSGPGIGGDLKSARTSPQRTRTPILTSSGVPTSVVEPNSMDSRFPVTSPGLNFPTHHLQPINTAANNIGINYKGPGAGTLERQNYPPMQGQFCRRNDNMPLNPNSNRPPQNKISPDHLDPITSLAQMSQQLTGCIPNAAANTLSNSSAGIIGMNDINMSSNVGPGMDNMMSTMDGSGIGMNHCTGLSAPHGMTGSANNASSFLPNNCHINPMMGPSMGQRLVNPKMCGAGSGFNPAIHGGMMGRDGPSHPSQSNYHGMMSSPHRMMGRMPMNFNNFNVAHNIQVKASTPNTIQYMPMRPQNNNSNNNTNNMRMPPSLDFLQRYANPAASGSHVMDNLGGVGHMGQGMPSTSSADTNKMTSAAAATNNPNSLG